MFCLEYNIKLGCPGFKDPKIVLILYPEDQQLCVATLLTEYILRTEYLRKGETSLFITSETLWDGFYKYYQYVD